MTSEHHLLESEVRSLQEDWTKKVAADAKYWLENDAKKRAISSAKSYEEFSDIVKAAHLLPISKSELAQLGKKSTSRNFSQMQIPERTTSRRATMHEENLIDQIDSPAKFADVWNKIGANEQLELLRRTPLATLDRFFQQELPPALLSDMTKFLSYDHETEKWLGQLLKIVVNSNRFGISRMFLSTEETEFYKTLIGKISTEKFVLTQGFGFTE